ncbi:MAG TPA: type II toxin-antitoxin system VapC family toxin [Gammaproteobacteria bacterium]|nr:type II toxin-antitoxin system VapC family toxin [Gammaproteobacteria bacterium]
MKKVVIDTNGLISFLTDRNPEQQEKIASLLNDAAELRVAVLIHHHVLSEFVYVLDSIYGISKTSINAMINDLAEMPGIEFISELDVATLLSLWPESVSDYGDAVLVSASLAVKGSVIATFDKNLKKSLNRLNINIFQ